MKVQKKTNKKGYSNSKDGAKSGGNKKNKWSDPSGKTADRKKWPDSSGKAPGRRNKWSDPALKHGDSRKQAAVSPGKNTINKTKKKPQDKWKKKDESDSEFEEVKEKSLDVGGFPSKGTETADSDKSDTEVADTRDLVRKQNRKHKKSGGFQSMGLSFNLLKGVLRKGYKIPTPIQRRTIPLILDGKDVVAMARTGSGKTAAFLLPMFERLKTHLTTGARALILSPTRELALQTLKFTKEIGKYTGIKSACILGGDRMEDQFSALHESPDILIATPGRFMHIMIEMNLKLKNVEYIVFDEADRLFEMGFAEQLNEVLQRVPETRQTLLFSATLPKLLVDFAKAGLHDPTLIRLDVDSKISEYLQMSFLECRSDDKTALLLHLLRNVMKSSEQTVVFVATKHHVEYLNMILTEAGIHCSCSYSSLDQTARKINVAKFRAKKTMVLLVTDLAARGIDIPMLDNVINYHFPGKPKLFVHRVGRVARAGRSGTAYSLISSDELPYVQDLHLFLGRSIKCVITGKTKADEDGLMGRVPQTIIDNEKDDLRHWLALTDLQSMTKVVHNAYGHYIRTRPAPSSESIKRMKEMASLSIGVHPMFRSEGEEMEQAKGVLLESMRKYKPQSTIFEVNSTVKSQAFDVMKKKRAYHEDVIVRANDENRAMLARFFNGNKEPLREGGEEAPTETEIMEVFGDKFTKKRKSLKDENYISYRPKDDATEKGLEVGSSFHKDAAAASLDMTGDDNSERKQMSNHTKWDRKKKKFVRVSGQEPGGGKRVKTESGAWVKASYKTNIYNDWLEKNKVAEREVDSDQEDKDRKGGRKPARYGGGKPRGRGQSKGPMGKTGPGSKGKGNPRGELKRKEEMLKDRRKKNKQAAFQKHRTEKKSKKGGARPK